MPYWARRTIEDKYGGHILHEDWILGKNIQFSWREKSYYDADEDKWEVPVYEIHVRERRGMFGWGRSKWYIIVRESTFEKVCRRLNTIIKQDNEKFWLDYIDDTNREWEEKKKEKLEEKFCGFGSDKAIGFGY